MPADPNQPVSNSSDPDRPDPNHPGSNRPDPPDEYSIDYASAPANDPGSGGSPPRARGELPPPVSGGRDWPAQARRGRVSDFWALMGCNAIVFGASVCIMVIELTASRLIANYLGQSLYTWTSVIGVVLAGISIGNYLGGWLADKYQPQKVLAWLFLISGLLTFSVLFLNGWARSTHRPEDMNWQLWVMLVVAWVFFLPALSLGTISPVTASMALQRSAKTGITVGNIYAWGALGSIVGTFLTGFWLIGEFGSREVIWVTSCALVVMGILVAAGQRAFRAAALFGALPLIIQFGIFSSTTEEQMSNLARDIAGIRSGWKTKDSDFAADQTALLALAGTTDAAAREALQAQKVWRRERKHAEDGWAEWGARLGKQLHSIGLTLAMRSDELDEYNDESNYYSINISDGVDDPTRDNVKMLRLDYLTHSYFNPENPTKLYYDYEKVYAAITLRAAALWNRPTQVRLESLPNHENFASEFPPAVKYDVEHKTLSVRGAMQLADYRNLLAIGPYAEYWQAVIATWEQTRVNWRTATRRTYGIIQTPLGALPEGIAFSDDLAATVHFDSERKALVCTRQFSEDEFWRLVGQGPYQEYVAAVRELMRKSWHTSSMFIGGGGFVFPRWIESVFPEEPLIDVAEIDPAVQSAVEKQLGLATEYGSPEEGQTRVRTHIGDARKFVDDQVRANEKRLAASEPAVTYDFVYGDAFNDLSVPWHLTTREFSTKVRELLTPGLGVYLVNIIDIYPRAQFPAPSDKVGDSRRYLHEPPPPGLAPVDWTDESWEPAPAPFAALQYRREPNGDYLLGLRGVMQDEMRDKLLQQAGNDATFKSAIGQLYQRSRVERVGRFLGRYVYTARQIFPFVYVFTSNEDDPGQSRDTFIVACSLQKMSFDNLTESGDHWSTGPFAGSERDESGRTVDFGEMTAVLELSRGVELTDNFAPVDNLLAPVFVSRGKDKE